MEYEDRENLHNATKTERRRKDKADTATVDKVLDPKTMEILGKLTKRQKLFDLGGSFSCGKEANVYTAKCSTSLVSKFIQKRSPSVEEVVPVVLKIYKTSTMLFKDRTRYIIDEKRFRRFCVSNSRKLIKLWSEKEVRNLKRLGKHGILCPRPLYLKRTVLIMSMIGDSGPSPRLKDADISDWGEVYLKCVRLMKDMYQKARLIHADFSEYNLIYHSGEVYVIDVSQSMDVGQENSNTFLMMDICNCNEFFSRKGVDVRSEIGLFEEITGLKVPEYLKVDGRLSKDSFIPSRAIEIANKEDLGLFITGYKEAGPGEECNTVDEDTSDFEPKEDSSIDIDSNDMERIEDCEEETGAEAQLLRSCSELPLEKISICIRRLRLKDPSITEREEKTLNRQRKALVKQMNRERRVRRAQRKEEYKRKDSKKRKSRLNK